MIKFQDRSELPKLTTKGFAVIDLPEDIKHLLFDFYNLLKPHRQPEQGVIEYI